MVEGGSEVVMASSDAVTGVDLDGNKRSYYRQHLAITVTSQIKTDKNPLRVSTLSSCVRL